MSDAALAACAARVGLDAGTYQANLQLDELHDRITAEKKEGVACGFTKVPGILVNGKPYLGIKTERELRDRIDEEWDLVHAKR